MGLGINPKDALTLISLVISMFGGKKNKRKALDIFPLINQAILQWESGVRDKLQVMAQTDPMIGQFKATLDQIYSVSRRP